MRINMEMKGLNKFQKRMLKTKAHLAPNIKKCVQQACIDVQERAKENAPRRTGYLGDNIEVSVLDSYTGEVTATADYAEYVELGTRFMEPQPFMKPAVDAVEHEFIKNLKKALMDDLDGG